MTSQNSKISLVKDTIDKKDEPYYILSDGNKYYENQLIIGLDNIREYKIKNIIVRINFFIIFLILKFY